MRSRRYRQQTICFIWRGLISRVDYPRLVRFNRFIRHFIKSTLQTIPTI
jgi:hypothetical protein